MKTIPKNIRLVKLTRMLYQGQMFNTTEACSNIYGVDFTESQRRNIQNDFKFLIDETDLPIDVYLLEGNEKEISIINRRIQSGGGKISDLELFASFIQKQNNVIFKGTGFQQVLNKTTTLLIEQHAIRDVEVNFMYRDDLYDFFENIETGMFNYSHFSEDINKIIDIILKAQILQIDYHTKSTGEIGRRVCVPLKIIYNSGTLYLYVYDIDKKGFYGTGGGIFTAENGKYIENIEFFSRDNSKVGISLEFNFEVKEGDWHHKGFSSKGDPKYEIWTQRKQ